MADPSAVRYAAANMTDEANPGNQDPPLEMPQCNTHRASQCAERVRQNYIIKIVK